MNHKIIFGVLAFSLVLSSRSLVRAEDQKGIPPVLSGYQETETLVVTAKRLPSHKNKTADNVIVYSRQDIDRLPARDLGEVLSAIPAVDIQLNGNFGQATALSINGSNARQVLLMVDGIPFNTQLSGQANPSQIPVGHIERIEVIKGASSSAWGSALGGVINVITRDVGDTARPKGSLTSSVAEFATTKNSLDLAGKAGDVGYFLTGSFFNTSGPQAIGDAEEKKMFGKLGLDLGEEARLIGSFGYNEAETHYALRTSTTIITQPYYTRYGKLLLDAGEDDFQWDMAYKYNDQEIRTDQILLSTGGIFASTVSENVYNGFSLAGSKAFNADNVLVAGADFDWHRFKSDKLLATGKSISMQAPYANYTLTLNAWDLTTGLRFDHNERFGSQVSPSFGGVYHFGDTRGTLARAKFSRAFNAPPLMHLFNSGTSFGFTILPNPGLEAERANTVELGLETRLFERLKLDAGGYYADIDDGIVVSLNTTTLTTQSVNIGNLRRQGGELMMEVELNDAVVLYGGGLFNDAVNMDTDMIVRDAGIARQKFTFGARYRDDRGFGAFLSGTYARWASSPGNANDRKPILDLRLTKAFPDAVKALDTEVFLNVHNLTNSKYWSNPSFPLPKRYFEGGFAVKF